MIEMIDDIAVEREETPAVATVCDCSCACQESVAEDSIGPTGADRTSTASGARIANDYDING